MRTIASSLLCMLLAACMTSSIQGNRTSSAKEDLQPLQSLLLFVASPSPDNAKEVEELFADQLRGVGVAIQLGTTHLPYDAPVDEVFAKADSLRTDGTLIVAVEQAGYVNHRIEPMPELGPVWARGGTAKSPQGKYSARLFDTRVKGKHTKVWQAKVDSSGGGLTSPHQLSSSAARQIVSELRSDGMIAAAEN